MTEAPNMPPETSPEDTESGTDTAAMSLQSVPYIGNLDARTRSARAFKSTMASYVQHLGGEDVITVAEVALLRDVAGVELCIARRTAALMQGENVDVAELVSLVNAHRRLLVTVGLKRRARDVTQGLPALLAGKVPK